MFALDGIGSKANNAFSLPKIPSVQQATVHRPAQEKDLKGKGDYQEAGLDPAILEWQSHAV